MEAGTFLHSVAGACRDTLKVIKDKGIGLEELLQKATDEVKGELEKLPEYLEGKPGQSLQREIEKFEGFLSTTKALLEKEVGPLKALRQSEVDFATFNAEIIALSERWPEDFEQVGPKMKQVQDVIGKVVKPVQDWFEIQTNRMNAEHRVGQKTRQMIVKLNVRKLEAQNKNLEAELQANREERKKEP